MDWIWWLLAPLAVTTAAAVWTWWAGRPPRPLSYEQSLSAHRRFLADLDRWTPPRAAPAGASSPTRRQPSEGGDREPAA